MDDNFLKKPSETEFNLPFMVYSWRMDILLLKEEDWEPLYP